MVILDAGHTYGLEGFERDYQTLEFVKRVGGDIPFNDKPHPGTNCQEVLRALIDRTEYLNKQKPCAETEAIIGNLKSALLLFELRAARCHGRQLELDSLAHLSCDPVCEKCRHLGCGEDVMNEKLLDIYRNFYNDINGLLSTQCLFEEDVETLIGKVQKSIYEIPIPFSSIKTGEKFRGPNEVNKDVFMRIVLPGNGQPEYGYAIGVSGVMRGYSVKMEHNQKVVRVKDDAQI